MKIALAQINPTIGDIDGNTGIHVDFARRAIEQGADLVVFPELSLCGYPPKDLLLKPTLIDRCLAALQLIAQQTRGADLIVGYPDRNQSDAGRPLHNAVALLRDGKIVSRHYKTLLPTYDVFDETRYFEPGPMEHRHHVIRAGGTDVGISICEDLWNDERLIGRRLYHQNPIRELAAAGARVLVNSSGSPFFVGKPQFRRELFAAQVKTVNRPLVYVNQVGGNDELVFDGHSVVFDGKGNLVAEARGFEQDLLMVDINCDTGECYPVSTSKPQPAASNATTGDMQHHDFEAIESIRQALVLGVKDYFRKCGFAEACIGLSGGIDSAVTAAIAVEALGADKVLGVGMPSKHSSQGSVSDARALADNLKMKMKIVPIEPMHAAFVQALTPAMNGPPQGLTDENIQARCRGVTMMAFSNATGAMLLTTGNKSEVAVGYCTLYGDMAGGLAVISDVPKTDVYRLARHLNATAGREIVPENTITKPPSAELRPDQKDSDSLPDYDTLDEILERYVELDESIEQIIEATSFSEADVRKVVLLIDRSEYKRRQAAPGLKVTSRAFGYGRRMPIAQKFRH